ncbi:MAG: hypothetical protein JOS17DRAFT_559424 [Linnemannia elongata]|nr:MAG: hypothetical protein JOS17DRAFT_559424 [Linnemannia elongata]
MRGGRGMVHDDERLPHPLFLHPVDIFFLDHILCASICCVYPFGCRRIVVVVYLSCCISFLPIFPLSKIKAREKKKQTRVRNKGWIALWFLDPTFSLPPSP